MQIPVSAIIATRNRAESLGRTLQSMAAQAVQPVELIVVDASTDTATERLCALDPLRDTTTRYMKSKIAGAAAQRNTGTAHASQPFVWYLDDDVVLEPDCLPHLWKGINKENRIGGVNAMIVNQSYREPGRISRIVYALLNGRAEQSYAGKCIGPAINFLPDDREDLPEIVATQWLNTTCTIYRREALPSPPFAKKFTGYSLLEDLALSVTVGKIWDLANVRTARVFHHSLPGEHKADFVELVRMDLVNRYYVMGTVMGRDKFKDRFGLLCWQFFVIMSGLRQPKKLPALINGSFKGARELFLAKRAE